MPEEKKGLVPELPAELKLEDWLPQEPTVGPPLPRWLNIFWPWYKPPVPPPVYTCPYCGAEFSTQEELNQHIASAHPEQPPVYTCPYCGATFSSQADLDAHTQAQHPSVPNIILLNLVISPALVEVGQKVIITLTASNTGNAAGGKIIVCQVDSSTAQQSISLEPGASIEVTFETTPAEAKTYTVSVDGLTGSFVATAPPVISAEITDGYIWDSRHHLYWHIRPGDTKVDLTPLYGDTIVGFVLVNKSTVPAAFDFTLRQKQWFMNERQHYEWFDLTPTNTAPIPSIEGVSQADKKIMPRETLEPGQKGFIAAPATIGLRWCTFFCDVTHNGQYAAGAMIGGWGGY